MQEAPSSWKRQDPGWFPACSLDPGNLSVLADDTSFRRLTSRTVRQQVCVVSGYEVCRNSPEQ